MDTEVVPPRAAPRPSWLVWMGLAVVLAAAAILSFDGLRGLALAVRIADRLAWLLPVAVDAGAAVSCATWLGGRTTATAARFAGRMTWALLAVTVLGNAAQLGMHANGITPPWWVVVLVGSIPPAVVGSVVHLIVLLVRGTDEADQPVRADRTVADLVAQTTEPAPVHADLEVVQTAVGPADHPALEPAPDHSDHPNRTGGPNHPEPARDLRSDRQTGGTDPLLAQAVRWAAQLDGPPSQRAVRDHFHVGRDRAVRLLEQMEANRSCSTGS